MGIYGVSLGYWQSVAQHPRKEISLPLGSVQGDCEKVY